MSAAALVPGWPVAVHSRRLAALVALGLLSTIAYASFLPLARYLGIAPMAMHVASVPLLFALYLTGIQCARDLVPTATALVVILGFGLLFRVLMLPTPVYLSSDPYRYIWDGRVQLAGVNPYRYPPAAPELAALRDGVIHQQINRPTSRTVYPPAAQWLFALAAAATPQTIVAWRVVLLVFEAVTVALLLRMLPRLGVPATAILVYAWSPLVVFEGIQAAHLEVAVIPVVLLALTLRSAGSSVRAGIALGAAVLMKLYPALFVPVWWRPQDWRFLGAVGATVALGYLPYAAALGGGALGFLPEYLGSAEDFNLGLRGVVAWTLGLTADAERAVLMGSFFLLLLAALLWIGCRQDGGERSVWRASALAAGAYLLLVPTAMHPWYVILIVPFLCVVPSSGWLYFSGAVTLSYVQYLVAPAPFPWWVWVGEYLPLYLLLSVAGFRRWRRQSPDAVSVQTT